MSVGSGSARTLKSRRFSVAVVAALLAVTPAAGAPKRTPCARTCLELKGPTANFAKCVAECETGTDRLGQKKLLRQWSLPLGLRRVR